MSRLRKVSVIIQARMNSSRLPGKVLLPMGNDTVLGVMIKRVKLANVDDVIIATTDNPMDEAIALEAEKNGVKCFRGSENNVIDRVIKAAHANWLLDYDYIVDISGDCPFIQASIINYLVDKIIKNGYDYVSNDVIDRSYPDGIDCQIYQLKTLKQAANFISNPAHMSHSGWNIPHYLYRVLKIWHWKAPEEYHWPELGLTLDEEKDYLFLKSIYDKYSNRKKYKQPFSIFTVIKDLKKNKELVTNSSVARKVPGNG